MKKKTFSLLLFCSICACAFSQALFNNNGADIYVTDGALMIVKTNSLHNNVSGGAGKIDNQGTIVVEGYVQNDALINGSGDSIRLFGDWINNSTYTTNNSLVELYGSLSGTPQLITGSTVTTFDNLTLSGGNVVKKQTINSVTSGTLALNSSELATDAFEMMVSNPATNAITRQTGFVSSTTGGKLSRATNTTGTYLFPIGSPSYVNGPSIFRPVDLTPATATDNIYGAMLVKGDATNDGFNVKAVDDSLCAVNPNFYHNLYHSTGADAIALTMYFDPSSDGNYTDEAHWADPAAGLWNYIGAPTAGSGIGLSTVNVGGISSFTPSPFALARKKFTIDAGGPFNIVQGQSADFDPVINTTSPLDTIVWNPSSTLSCADCLKPVATPEFTTVYSLSVTDATGCSASDSVVVNVMPQDLLVPTGFSPNNDGENDFFHVLNKNLTKVDLQVYNRWGEKVYETDDVNARGWDGTYKGVQQEMGVFTWQCQYQFSGSTKLKTGKGNVTLLR